MKGINLQPGHLYRALLNGRGGPELEVTFRFIDETYKNTHKHLRGAPLTSPLNVKWTILPVREILEIAEIQKEDLPLFIGAKHKSELYSELIKDGEPKPTTPLDANHPVLDLPLDANHPVLDLYLLRDNEASF